MMNKKRTPILLLLLPVFLLLGGIVWAQVSGNYRLRRQLLSDAGGKMASANYGLRSSMGQSSAVGASSSTIYGLSAGYWHGQRSTHICWARLNDDPTDYTTVQAAVDTANDGDVVKVAGYCAGVEARAGVTQTIYISKSITLRGGYTTANWTTPDPDMNPTTLDAQGQGRVLYITGDTNPTVEGLRITGGDATGLGGNNIFFEPDAGGGIYVITATVTISGCRVYSNTSPGYGGGLFFADTDVVFSNNAVFNNTAGWGGGGLRLGRYYSRRRSNAILNGNAISDNAADGSGGGLSVRNSDAILSENTISNNTADGSGGGLYLDWDHDTTLNGNTISGNTAADDGGGLYLDYSDATLNGNTISGNTANGNGGGLCLGDESNATLDNSAVTDNQAFQRGAGLYVWGSSLRLRHTTIARNSGGDGSGVYITGWSQHSMVALTNTILTSHTVGITVTAGNTATLEATLWGSGEWTNITDWGGDGDIFTGTVNLWGNPAFVNPDNQDYHIGSSSTAVDAGVDAGLLDDMDGDPRPAAFGYDIGADERPGAVFWPQKIGQPAFNAGQTITYTILIPNVGVESATNVILTETLPVQQQSLAAMTSQGSCTLESGWGTPVVCTMDNIGAGSTAVVTLTVEVTTTQPDPLPFLMRNTVQVRADNAANETFVDVYMHDCHVRVNGVLPEYTYVQTAIDVATQGDTVMVAGFCTGVNERGGLRQVVYLDKGLTLRGGYSKDFFAWDPVTYPTILDAVGEGRVLYVTGKISPTIEGLHITGGYAKGLGGGWEYSPDAGGGVYVITATATISGCRVYSNTSPHRGGGLYLSGSDATLNGNIISGNTDQYFGYGGGLCLDYSDATLNGNTISGNTAACGGGLYLYDSDATLNGNDISGNTANEWGGGLYLSGSDAALNHNTVSGNTAMWGGGLCLKSSHATLTDNTVSDNTASEYGGGLYLYYSDGVTLNGNTVSGNTASSGGGLHVSGSDVTLNGNTISGNTASSSCGGLSLSGGDATLSGNIISGNTASSSCGGLGLSGGDATLSGNIITSNTADYGVGGLRLFWITATLTNNIIADNQGNGVGNGLYIEDSSLRLLHTTIARNIGGDGSGVYVTDAGGYGYYSTVVLTNTILVSHSVGIIVTSGNTATLEATLWGTDTWANTTDWGGAGTIITGTHNYWGDPAFVDPDAGDYHISAASAAIDKGVDTGVTVDIDSEPRPQGTGYDLGADEYWPPGALKHIYLPLVLRGYL